MFSTKRLCEAETFPFSISTFLHQEAPFEVRQKMGEQLRLRLCAFWYQDNLFIFQIMYQLSLQAGGAGTFEQHTLKDQEEGDDRDQ